MGSKGDTTINPNDSDKSVKRLSHAGEGTRLGVLLAGILLLVSMICQLGGQQQILATVGLLAGLTAVANVVPEALRDVLNGRLSASVLVVVAAVAGILGGDSMEAGLVAFLYEIGKMVGEWAIGKASDASGALKGLLSSKAHVVMHDGEIIDMPLSEMSEDSLIRVLPGERVPTDGRIVRGASEFDESQVTGRNRFAPHGESELPDVIGGSLNMGSVVEMRMTSLPDESVVSRMAKLVGEANEGKEPCQSMLGAIGGILAPATAITAIIVAVAVPAVLSVLGANPSWGEWIRRGTALLAVSCSQSITIGASVALMSGIGLLAKCGTVVRGSDVIREASETDLVMLDKAGGITTGRASVEAVAIPDGYDPTECLVAMVALESSSDHPTARAIFLYAMTQLVGKQCDMSVSGLREVPGHGMAGTVNGHDAYIGGAFDSSCEGDRQGWLYEVAMELARCRLTPIVIRIDGEDRMALGIGNEVRKGAEAEIGSMAMLTGNAPLVLTGDMRQVAITVSGDVGIDEGQVMSDMLPDDKAEAVMDARSEGHHVLVVGDGARDASSLAEANVGIAVWEPGGGVSFGAANAIAMGNPLVAVNRLLLVSRITMRRARIAPAVAFVAKAVTAVLALAGITGMGMVMLEEVGMTFVMSLVGLGVMRTDLLERDGDEMGDDGEADGIVVAPL